MSAEQDHNIHQETGMQPQISDSNQNSKPRQSIFNAFNKILRKINQQKNINQTEVINLQQSKPQETSTQRPAQQNQIAEIDQSTKKTSSLKRPTDEADLQNFYIEISFEDLQQLQQNQLADFVQKREKKMSKIDASSDIIVKGFKTSKKLDYSQSQIGQPFAQSQKYDIIPQQRQLYQESTAKKSTKQPKQIFQDDEQFTFNQHDFQNQGFPQNQQQQQDYKKTSKKAGKYKPEKNFQLPQLYQVVPAIVMQKDEQIEKQIQVLKNAKLGKKSSKLQSKIKRPVHSSSAQGQTQNIQKGLKQECKDQSQDVPKQRLNKVNLKKMISTKKQSKDKIAQKQDEVDFQSYILTQNNIVDQTNKQPFLLGKATLQELVHQLFSKKLINSTHFYQFQQNNSASKMHEYLNKFDAGKLHQYSFDIIKFTPLDHRRISQLLYNLYPQQYRMSELKSNDAKLLQFLLSLYDLSAEDYYNLWICIDKISKIKWWSKILITQDQKLMQNSKEKRVARKRAEQAAAAVHSVMESVQLIQKTHSQNNNNHPKRTLSQVYQIDDEPDPVQAQQAKIRRKEQQKQRKFEKQRQLNEISKIRNMVSNFNTSSKTDTVADRRQPTKKVKFI